MAFPMKKCTRVCCAFFWYCLTIYLWIQVIILPIVLRVASLTLGQSHCCASDWLVSCVCLSLGKSCDLCGHIHNILWGGMKQILADYNLAITVLTTLQWRHNEHDGVSNHQPHDCLLNRPFRCRSKKISKLRVTGLCAENSPVTGEFPAQMASNEENVSIWWRHHANLTEQHLHNVAISGIMHAIPKYNQGGVSKTLMSS